MNNNIVVEKQVLKYNRFSSLGFDAGIILKNAWREKSEPYGFLRNDLLAGKYDLIIPTQTHSNLIANVHAELPVRMIYADGVISGRDDICLTVTTADCLPLLFAVPSRGLFGAVHIGWRGFVGGILETFRSKLGGFDIDWSDIHIHLGPALEQCCFETGDEVAVLFEQQYVEIKKGRYYVDLRNAIADLLVLMGVDRKNILGLDDCTKCGGDKYYSYRRDGRTPAQMVSFICKNDK